MDSPFKRRRQAAAGLPSIHTQIGRFNDHAGPTTVERWNREWAELVKRGVEAPRVLFPLLETLLDNFDIAYEALIWLPPAEMLTLFTISKKFQQFCCAYVHQLLPAYAKVWVPSAVPLLPFYDGHPLFMIARTPFEMPYRAPGSLKPPEDFHVSHHTAKFFVTWLQKISRRCAVVDQIHAKLDVPAFPASCAPALLKLWFILEVDNTVTRANMLADRALFTDRDLQRAECFFFALDEASRRFAFRKHVTVRKVLMGQRSLRRALDYVEKRYCSTHVDLVREWARLALRPKPRYRGKKLFGLQARELGKGCIEGWGNGFKYLRRADELVTRELINRKIHPDTWLSEIVEEAAERGVSQEVVQRAMAWPTAVELRQGFLIQLANIPRGPPTFLYGEDLDPEDMYDVMDPSVVPVPPEAAVTGAISKEDDEKDEIEKEMEWLEAYEKFLQDSKDTDTEEAVKAYEQDYQLSQPH